MGLPIACSVMLGTNIKIVLLFFSFHIFSVVLDAQGAIRRLLPPLKETNSVHLRVSDGVYFRCPACLARTRAISASEACA